MNEDLPIETPIETPVEAVGDESVARNFIHSEVEAARRSLRNTQIGSVLIAGLLCGYVMYLTARFRSALEPREAATIVQGLVTQKVDQQGPEIKEYIKKEVPNYIRQAPDYVLKELPMYRQQIQERANQEIERFAKESADRLATQVDKFLDEQKDAVAALIKDGQDPAATAKITSGLKSAFVAFLDETQAGGESLKSKLDQALDLLTKVEARMNRLANGKSLEPQELSAKRAIAVLMRTIDEKRMEEGRTEAIAPQMVEEARRRIEDAANSARSNVETPSPTPPAPQVAPQAPGTTQKPPTTGR
ncbi:MAG: hypothetical protein C4320_05175 [Armatimonadota bacterium]